MKVLSEDGVKAVLPEGGRQGSKVKLASIWVIEDPDNPGTNPNHNEKLKEEICADFETAIRLTGSGKFNWFLLFICGSVFANSAVSITMISFVLPSAQCDFSMSSEDKGRLNAAPHIGLMLGALSWGLLADARGRKGMIVCGLTLDAVFNFASSLVQSFWIFFISRVLCGFGIAAVTALLYAYMGEFLSSAKRDRMLSWLELSWAIAITVLPGLASVLIPQAWTLGVGGPLEVKPWRLFVALCSVPSVLNALCISVLPEAPKYLMSKNRLDEALAAFQWIHRCNEGEGHAYAVTSLQPPEADGSAAGPGGPLAAQARALFTRPLLTATATTLAVQAIVMCSYFTLVLWFPDLFERLERFRALHPNRTASICEVTAAVADVDGDASSPCAGPVPAGVFHHAAYIGVACVVAGVGLVATIDCLGKRTILVMSMLISGVCTLGLNFVWTSMQNLILVCIYEAIAGLSISVLLCVVVELMPTSHRAFALALQHTTGRLGATLGNIVFGWLIDFNCDVALICGGLLLIGGGLLALFIPKANQHQEMH